MGGWRRGLRRGFRGLVLLTLLYGISTLVQIWYGARQDDRQQADAIVVLGAAQWAGRPSPVLRARLDHAIDLYHAGVAPLLITTGGHGPDPRFSEAGVGAAYAERRGVPAAAILSEERGESTWESLVEVARLAEQEGIETIILVSDPFHLARAREMAGALHLEAWTSPTPYSRIDGQPGVSLIYTLRETLSITVFRLRLVQICLDHGLLDCGV